MGTCGYTYNPPKKNHQEHQQTIFCRSFCSGISGRFFPPKKNPFAVWFFAPPGMTMTDWFDWWPPLFHLLPRPPYSPDLPGKNKFDSLGWLEKIGLDLDDPYLDLLGMMSSFCFLGEKANNLHTWKIISARRKKPSIMGRPTLTPSCSLLKQTSCLMEKTTTISLSKGSLSTIQNLHLPLFKG